MPTASVARPVRSQWNSRGRRRLLALALSVAPLVALTPKTASATAAPGGRSTPGRTWRRYLPRSAVHGGSSRLVRPHRPPGPGRPGPADRRRRVPGRGQVADLCLRGAGRPGAAAPHGAVRPVVRTLDRAARSCGGRPGAARRERQQPGPAARVLHPGQHPQPGVPDAAARLVRPGRRTAPVRLSTRLVRYEYTGYFDRRPPASSPTPTTASSRRRCRGAPSTTTISEGSGGTRGATMSSCTTASLSSRRSTRTVTCSSWTVVPAR